MNGNRNGKEHQGARDALYTEADRSRNCSAECEQLQSVCGFGALGADHLDPVHTIIQIERKESQTFSRRSITHLLELI
jgi:hypothetical protein